MTDRAQKHREAAAARYQATEDRLTTAAEQMLEDWFTACRAALNLEAVIASALPNPADITQADPVLASAYGTHVAPVLEASFGEAFATYSRGVISDQSLREAFSAQTFSHIQQMPGQMQTQLNDILREGIATGASNDRMQAAIWEAFQVNGQNPRYVMRAGQAEDAQRAAKEALEALNPDLPGYLNRVEQLQKLEQAAYTAERRATWALENDFTMSDARRWARTASTEVENHGQLAGMQEWQAVSGEHLQKEWIATSDARTREDHIEAEGQRVELDEAFIVGDAELGFPADPDGPMEQVANCRCSMLEILADPAPVDDPQADIADGVERPDLSSVDMGAADAHAAVVDDAAEFEPNEGSWRKTRDGEWVVMMDRASIEAYLGDDFRILESLKSGKPVAVQVPVTSKAGVTKNVLVQPSVGKGFDVDGVNHVYLHTVERTAGMEYRDLIASAGLSETYNEGTIMADLAPAETETPVEVSDNRRPFTAVLTVEGTTDTIRPTGDQRAIGPDALIWRELPLPLLWQEKTGVGHDGAYHVASITEIARVPDEGGAQIIGTGYLLDLPGEAGEKVATFAALLEAGVTYPSIDMDDLTDKTIEIVDDGTEFGTMLVTSGRIMAATCVATPAFAEASIALGSDQVSARATTDETAITAAATDVVEVGSRVVILQDGEPTGDAGVVTAIDQDEVTVLLDDGETKTYPQGCVQLETDDADSEASIGEIEIHDDGTVTATKPDGTASHVNDIATALDFLIASAAPVTPPTEWFHRAEPDRPQALTITENGQVYGHLALWGTCHTGNPNVCITPPVEDSFDFFNLGETVTTDGSHIPTGTITLGGGHADLHGGWQAAVEHYDETGCAVADIHVTRGVHGIWFAGALRSTVTPEQVRELRAAPLSGDWRRRGGQLRLIAALAVNTPGFPVPRTALAEQGGVQVALAASGVLQPGTTLAVNLAEVAATVRKADKLAAEIGRDPASRADALAAAIHGHGHGHGQG
jgi:hypothetical protein